LLEFGANSGCFCKNRCTAFQSLSRPIHWRPRNYCARNRGRPRFRSMAGRKTMHPQRKPRAQSPPSRPGENIQTGGNKIGVQSGATKSETTRAGRRFGGMRSDAR
jgi:hypothetical protein